MSDTIQIVLGLLILVAVFVLAQWAAGIRLRRAARYLIRDLETRKAFDPENAADLPYAKKHLLQMGLRDFRPKALQSLVAGGVVGLTQDGKYYLLRKDVRI